MIILNSITDTLIRLKNGSTSTKKTVNVIKNKKTIQILNVLYKEGYILGYQFLSSDSNLIQVSLKYINSVAVIKKIKIFSKVSKKIYCNLNMLSKQKNNNQLTIVSTSKGYLSANEALKLKIGGELICLIS